MRSGDRSSKVPQESRTRHTSARTAVVASVVEGGGSGPTQKGGGARRSQRAGSPSRGAPLGAAEPTREADGYLPAVVQRQLMRPHDGHERRLRRSSSRF